MLSPDLTTSLQSVLYQKLKKMKMIFKKKKKQWFNKKRKWKEIEKNEILDNKEYYNNEKNQITS